jgi:hypothetical protein
MILTIIGTILWVGALRVPQDAVAVNMTLQATNDNRVRIQSFLYSDNVVCSTDGPSYTFNTVSDAIAYWNSLSPPFATQRYFERLKISTNR